MTAVEAFKQDILTTLAKHDASLHQRWIATRFTPHGETLGECISCVNHFLRLQLGSVTEDTITLRSVMHDDHDRDQWFNVFEKRLIPSLVKFNLPK